MFVWTMECTQKKILVTGATGQLGTRLLKCAAMRSHLETVGLGQSDLDVCDAGAVVEALNRHRPDVVIHAAAFTQSGCCRTCGSGGASREQRGCGACGPSLCRGRCGHDPHQHGLRVWRGAPPPPVARDAHRTTRRVRSDQTGRGNRPSSRQGCQEPS